MDKVSSMVNSFHDLWSLPVQISIAFVLLYLQVDVAFVAGVVIIIGINRKLLSWWTLFLVICLLVVTSALFL